MRYYRDLQLDETLQVGDERFRGGNDWAAIGAELFGLTPNDVPWGLFRRPVNLPVLQLVTPEAMTELEDEEIRTIAVLSQRSVKAMMWGWRRLRQWVSRAGQDNPLEWQWFIDLSTIPETT